MLKVKEIVKRLLLREKYNSSTFIKYLNGIGAKIDETVYFVSPSKNIIDVTRPYLLEIGAYVTITEGCSILTHGFDWSVLKIKYDEVIGSGGKVVIRENTFIGVNSTILKGVTIGPNTIIGAGSLVTRDIPGDVVAAGNPCKVLCSIKDYYKKRKNEYVSEAIEIVRSYYQRFHCVPPREELSEFYWLFDRNVQEMPDVFLRKISYGNNKIETLKKMNIDKPMFSSYEDFCKYVLENYL